MARVIHQKYYGPVSDTGNTQFLIRAGDVWIPGAPAATTANGEAWIVRQKKSDRFLVTDGTYTGLCDLVSVAPTTGVAAGGIGELRIPVDTTDGNDSVNAVLTFGGSGYNVGDVITILGGGGTGFQIQVASETGNVITGITLLSGGTGYTSIPTGAQSNTGAGDDLATFDLTLEGIPTEFASKVMLHRVRTFAGNDYKWTINEPSPALDVTRAYADRTDLKSGQITTG